MSVVTCRHACQSVCVCAGTGYVFTRGLARAVAGGAGEAWGQPTAVAGVLKVATGSVRHVCGLPHAHLLSRRCSGESFFDQIVSTNFINASMDMGLQLRF